MKVRQLIEDLSKLDPEADVWHQWISDESEDENGQITAVRQQQYGSNSNVVILL